MPTGHAAVIVFGRRRRMRRGRHGSRQVNKAAAALESVWPGPQLQRALQVSPVSAHPVVSVRCGEGLFTDVKAGVKPGQRGLLRPRSRRCLAGLSPAMSAMTRCVGVQKEGWPPHSGYTEVILDRAAIFA